MKIFNYLFLLVLLFVSCKDKHASSHQRMTQASLSFSDEAMFKSYEIIQLETNENSLMSDMRQIKISGNIIFILDARNQIFIFNTDGKFIGKILSGRGRNECIAPYDFVYDKTHSRLIVLDVGIYLKYFALDRNLEQTKSIKLKQTYEQLDVINNSLLLYKGRYSKKGDHYIHQWEDYNTINQFEETYADSLYMEWDIRNHYLEFMLEEPFLNINQDSILIQRWRNDTTYLFVPSQKKLTPFLVFDDRDNWLNTINRLGGFSHNTFDKIFKDQEIRSNISTFRILSSSENYCIGRMELEGKRYWVRWNLSHNNGVLFERNHNDTPPTFIASPFESGFISFNSIHRIKNSTTEKEYPDLYKKLDKLDENGNPVMIIYK